MPVRVTLSSPVPSGVPAEGWKVGYRIKGTVGAYLTPSGSPFMAAPIIFDTTDAIGTLYEGFIQRDCGTLDSTQYLWVTPCACPATYAIAADGKHCFKNDIINATVTNLGYCFAPSTNAAYSNYGMRVYTAGVVNADLDLAPGSVGGHIYGNSTYSGPSGFGQWANPTADPLKGPLNREGVWIDSDCDGTKNALGSGTNVTISFLYNNIGATRTAYVGIAADNGFSLKVNDNLPVGAVGRLILDFAPGGDKQFKIWHVIPITLVPGVNYINGIGVGDGSVNDAIGVVMYDNTADQILAATGDGALSIPFKSSSLRCIPPAACTPIDIATCPTGYSLDVTGGAGNYKCVKTLVSICNP